MKLKNTLGLTIAFIVGPRRGNNPVIDCQGYIADYVIKVAGSVIKRIPNKSARMLLAPRFAGHAIYHDGVYMGDPDIFPGEQDRVIQKMLNNMQPMVPNGSRGSSHNSLTTMCRIAGGLRRGELPIISASTSQARSFLNPEQSLFQLWTQGILATRRLAKKYEYTGEGMISHDHKHYYA
jgi:hypothetical protein